MPLLVTNEETRRLIPAALAVEVIEEAYRSIGAGEAVTRTRTQTFAPTGRPDTVLEFRTMDGAVPAFGTLAIRILPDVVSWPEVDGKRRRVYTPVRDGKYLAFDMIFDLRTGDLVGVIQDAYLQRLRIAGAHGAAAKWLARRDARSVGLLGSGFLARGIVEGIAAVRRIDRVRVFSPTREHREKFVEEMGPALRCDVRAVDTPEAAYRGAEIVVTSTNSLTPVFSGAWLEPGMHLSSILTWEVDDRCFSRADLTVLSMRAGGPNEGQNYYPSTLAGKIPQLQAFQRSIQWDRYPELGQVVAGLHPGRQADDEVAFFCNNVGFGAQFAALGGKILELARRHGLGREFSIDDWYETVR